MKTLLKKYQEMNAREAASVKIELGLAEDFEKKFDRANNSTEAIGQTLIKALSKAENAYKQNASQWDDAATIGDKLKAAYKEIGAKMPTTLQNQIDSAAYFVKEDKKLASLINRFYSNF